jgi:hypothetical protein
LPHTRAARSGGPLPRPAPVEPPDFYPRRADGKTLFPFRRIFIIATAA